MKSMNFFRIWNRNNKKYEIGQKNKRNEHGKLRTILKSLRYANKKDLMILASSMLSAIIVGFISPFNVYFFFTPVLAVFIKAETPGNPYHINMTEEIPNFIKFGYGYFINGSVTIIFGIIQIMASEIASRNIMTRIKTAYLTKMMSIEPGWYDWEQEQFVNIVSNDLQKMAILFDSKMTNAAEIFSFFVFGCIAGFFVSWKIALMTLGMMFVAMMVMYFILHISKKKGKKSQESIKKCTKIVSDVLGNARTVAAYGGEHKEIQRYTSVLKMTNKYALKHTIVISTGKAFNYFQMCTCYAIAYYFSVNLFLSDEFNPGFLGVILTAQINAIYHCTYLLSTMSDLNMAADSACRVMEFLDAETNHSKSIKLGIEPNTFKPEVSFKNVQFSYPTALHTKVLQELTLDIEPGKVTAIVGTSGAGKSTIVNLISLLYNVSAGQILIGGVDIQKLNISWLRNQIGVVRQEPTLFDTSIEENIRYGKTDATLEEIIEAAKISYAHGFIEKLPSGYDTIVGERGIKLSGGQKQRIAIARAIVKKPKLLILDEATSSLDFHSEGVVLETLDNAMRGRTTLIIAHRMSTVKKADVIYALKEGRIVEKGTHDELMELKGHYYSLAKIQADKVVILDKGSVLKEELMEEPKSYDGNLEAPNIGTILFLNERKHKIIVVLFLAILFAAFSSTFLPTFYYIFTLICQSFTKAKDELRSIAILRVSHLIGLGAFIFLSVVWSDVTSTVASQQWLQNVQEKAFKKIVSMDISWFDKSGNSPNECLEVLTQSPRLIESVTGDRAAQVVVFMLSLLFSIGYSLFVSASVTLASLPIFLIFITINIFRMKSRGADARSVSLSTRSTKLASEYIQCVKTVQILNCQKYLTNLYQELLQRSKREAMVSVMWYGAVYGFSRALIQFSMGVIIVYGADVVASGSVQGTALIGVLSALSLASSLAGPALILTSQYPNARQAIKQISRIAYAKSSLDTLTDQGTKPEIRGNIAFQDVTFSYPTREKVQVLKKLNLQIEAGKTVALVGHSGCGKSTIVSLLERFYLADEGKILIDGNDINNINVRYLRSQMGLVSQEPVLFDMTIKENILYGLEQEVTMDKIIEAAKIGNAHSFIMKLPQAYDTSVGERGSKLSAGQKQRIAIARAVLRDPKILLLDEATSALDTENEKAVQEALENASIGRTTVVIAHRLSTIRKADKIVVLQSGEVIEEGNHQQLMEMRGHYCNLLNR